MSLYVCFSIMERVFTEVRYHPLIENFPEYPSLRREPVPYNETEKFGFGPLVLDGNLKSILPSTTNHHQTDDMTPFLLV